ncbi:MAG: protein CpxP [Marinoscillum sp.]|jgi:protein CpxP
MTSKKWFYISMFLLVMNLGTLSFILIAKGGKRGPNERQNREQFMSKRLGLSQAQTESMRTLRVEHFKQMKQLEMKLSKEKQALFNKSISEASAVDIAENLNKLNDLHREADSLTYVHFSEMRAVCREDQKAKYDQFLMEMMRRGLGSHGGPMKGRDENAPSRH